MDPLHNAPVDDARRPPHPLAYTLLIVPFGATSGFVTVALAFLATKVGLTVQQGATLIAFSMFPNVWKFFWAPVADKTLTRKRWYLISIAVSALGVFGMATVPLGPATMTPMIALIVLTSIASTFTGFAVESMVAHLTPPADRGSVSGWFQAGNLGGSGLGGGLGLYLLENLPHAWMAGVVLALVMLACALPLLFVPEVPAERSGGTLGRAIGLVAADMWQVLRSREGMLCATLCFLPVGTGAAGGVLAQAQVAAHWGAGDHEVALVQGFLTGGVSMVGCLVGGYVCSRLSPRVAYALFGGLMAAVTALMAVAAATTAVYVGFNLAYAFVTGLCYAAFSAFVLDAIGAGHAATKYNGFASLSNAPIWYVGLVLAWADTAWGPGGMLMVESALGVVGIALFGLLALVLRTRPAPAAAASAPA